MLKTNVIDSVTVVFALEEVRLAAGDPELAHTLEDEPYQAVLELVAGGHPQSQLMAKYALASKGIEFSRWCA